MEGVAALEAEIDEAAAEMWGITKGELSAIQKALRELERPKRKATPDGRVSEEEEEYANDETET